jgi:spermidine synthase
MWWNWIPDKRILRNSIFGEPNARLTIYHEDGRTFLNSREKKYDASFWTLSDLSIPFRSISPQKRSWLYDALNPDGVLLTNVISSIEEKRQVFTRNTLHIKQFSACDDLSGSVSKQPGRSQNVVLLALKNGSVQNPYCQSGTRWIFATEWKED